TDVIERVLGLSVQPHQIIFTNLLQTAGITPSVDFEFRGKTPLIGAGTGVSFSSSHPHLIAVTPGGVVFPLAETNGEDVRITVSYSGTESVEVPVQADPTKFLTGLEFEGVEGGALELSRLNERFELPAVVGVFNDGTESQIG